MNTIKSFKLPAAMLALTFGILFTSCDKDDDDTPAQKNITETVVASADFSLLETAVLRAGLEGTLATTPNLTVFAPTNAAFTAAGLNEAAINATPVATLQAILSYHVLPTTVSSANVPAGPNAAVTTLNGQSIFATKNTNGVFVNGVKVVTADVAASNGVIHAIDRVLFPASGNIVATAQANPNLSYLVAAVLRADASGTSISGALSAAGPLTVFAPTNQAFIDAGFPTIASIQAADPNTLKNILLYHVVAARVFSSDLTEGAQPTTAQGGKVTIKLAGGAKVRGASNTADSNITITDIVTTNGVVHVIDRVLLP
jgi:uncharacterized surface protein with fasciclin (FAS1) repeats